MSSATSVATTAAATTRNVDYISYAPAFGSDASNLLADAIANREPPSNLPPYQGIQASFLEERRCGSTRSCWPRATTPATAAAT